MKKKDDELGEGDEFAAYKDLIAGSSSDEEEDEEDSADEGSETLEKEQTKLESIR